VCHDGVLVASSRSRHGFPLRSSFHSSLLLLLVLATGCETDPATVPLQNPEPLTGVTDDVAAEGSDEAAHGPSYSPFVVHMSQPGLPFGEISFKDVGMSLPEEERVVAYETLAESLSLELQRRMNDISVEVHHTVEILDPAAHLACEGQHIYVDLWKAGEGWGYSLWSGCGEEDEFAHEEVEPTAVAIAGTAESFEPLTREIVASLVDATRTGCFTKHC
jgi:hypothetical protein